MRIAYARHGTGPPLVIATCWLSHLQFDWESPVWRHFVADLGQVATIVRYDERGYGLSDWEVDDFGLEARVADLEAVVDHAGLDRFALMAMAQGGPVADRVRRPPPGAGDPADVLRQLRRPRSAIRRRRTSSSTPRSSS